MKSFGIYLIESGIALSFFYAFYWFFLRNEIWHFWNRVYLLTTLMVSSVFPWMIPSIQKVSAETFSYLLDPVLINNSYAPRILSQISDSLNIVSIIYISGVVFFCLRFLSNLVRIQYLYFRFEKHYFKGFTAVILDHDTSPSTFFNILFISRSDFKSGKIDEMMAHESAHREELHSLDILLLEVMTLFHWFNPFLWLLRYSLKSEHEFRADSQVLKKGFDAVEYQKLLFEKSLGITSFDLTNGFNYSLLKKRINRMTFRKTGSLTVVKYLVSMPVLLGVMIFLSVQFNAYGQNDGTVPVTTTLSNVSGDMPASPENIVTVVDVMPKYKGGDLSGALPFIQRNVIFPKSLQESGLSAFVLVQFCIDQNGQVTDEKIVQIDIRGAADSQQYTKGVQELSEEILRVVKLLTDLTPAQKDGKSVQTQFTFPVRLISDTEKG